MPSSLKIMRFEVDIEEMANVPVGAAAALEMAAVAALDSLDVPDGAGVTIVLADDAYLQSLNSQFRQEDHPTDVLSFPAGDPIPGLPEESTYLGDIAISVPYAQRQADQQGHQLLEELQLLTIHGILHLDGFDHLTPEEKDAMWQQQKKILELLGLGHVQPTEG